MMMNGLHLLVVDDNPADIDLVRELLGDAGPSAFEVESMARLAVAVARLERGGIDLVLLDLGLPDSQGLATLHTLIKAAPDVAVIVFTGRQDPELGVTAVRDGAQDFLVKGRFDAELLTRSIHHAVERKRLQAVARERETLLATTLASTIDGILVVDNDGTTILTNQRFADLWEITPDVLATRSDQMMLEHVQDKLIDPDSFLRKVHLLYETKDVDLDILHFKNGKVLERDSLPLLSGTTRIGRVWSFRDVTARSVADERLHGLVREKEALVREVHHRVKNNLQVITSLLRLESTRSIQPDTKAVLTEMQGRVRTMALLHEVLHQSESYAAIDLRDYLRRIATETFHALATSPGTMQLRFDLATVPVRIDQAMPCGLLVSELLSNCLRHGFTDGRTGEILVELHPIDGGPMVCLRVSDTGVGLPADFAARSANSLGLQLVSDLARQLGGALEIGPGPVAAFTVVFPVREVKE